MKKSVLFAAVPLICLSVGVLGGCGFHLRGSQTPAIPVAYQHIQLDIPAQAQALYQPLSVYLQSLGATVDKDHTAPILKITDYQQTRQLLSGRLTEVQLRLAITYHLENNLGKPLTSDYRVYARRSYQYDIATVNTENQEESRLIEEMNRDTATQIARQLHAGRIQLSTEPAQQQPGS